MEKSINNRYYLDYNATSPLADKVKTFLGKGDFLFGNPSSIHQTGKASRKKINETIDFLYKTFSLSPDEYSLYFHSGATEGINTYFKGIALKHFKEKIPSTFIFSNLDHSAVMSLEEDLISLGHEVVYFSTDKNSEFDLSELIKLIQRKEVDGKKVFLNFTVINNETGVVWPLTLAEAIKDSTDCQVHVDAVQLVGKIENWKNLSSKLDVYNFSAHKFGALKGIGFTFIKKSSEFKSLLTGGNQQDGYRSGTENALGVYSVKLALEEMLEFEPKNLRELKNDLQKNLESEFGDKLVFVNKNSKATNVNTLFLIVKDSKADQISMLFDLAQIDISTGSACSSGIFKENRILKNLGYDSLLSLSGLRISLGPSNLLIQKEELFDRVVRVIKKLSH